MDLDPLLHTMWDKIRSPASKRKDNCIWTLTPNDCFFVWSFYRILVAGGQQCKIIPIILKSLCLQKINTFNWLAWDNKFITLDNLTTRGCNRLPTTTCILCHGVIETADHLFICCPIAIFVWNHFPRDLGANMTANFMAHLRDGWYRGLDPSHRPSWSLLVRAIVWQIWLERNDCMFNFITFSAFS